MLFNPRTAEIVALVNQNGSASVRELAGHFGVTEVTIRRDLKKLEQLQVLERTHGGAISLSHQSLLGLLTTKTGADAEEADDALVLAPIPDRVAHTLRERALRKRIPIVAESCPQPDAIYLGPDNIEVARTLGEWTGRFFQTHMGATATAHILDITQNGLPNGQERSKGFLQGIRSVFQNSPEVFSIDGNGLYNDALQVARDALVTHPEINIIFGVNDDSILAGIQAYLDLGRDPVHLVAVNVGGEGKTLFDTLNSGNALRACAALFPEIVGRLAIDIVVRLWDGETLADAVITPYAILTNDNLTTYYRRHDHEWGLIPERLPELLTSEWLAISQQIVRRTLSFVILYRTHEWYQNVARAMQARAITHSIHLQVRDWKDNLRDEIQELRRLIGKLAASYIDDGDTIFLDASAITRYMTLFLREFRKLTVITNSADIFQRLHEFPNIELIITGGKFDASTRSFGGHGVQLLLNDVRADKAFIGADGISTRFGISAADPVSAEIKRLMMSAAREVIVLADHTVLDVESNYRVTALEAVDTLITDAGIRSSQSLEYAAAAIRILVAGRLSI